MPMAISQSGKSRGRVIPATFEGGSRVRCVGCVVA